jgi:[ribosomal protein S18]-alanine N-acetyltransferase
MALSKAPQPFLIEPMKASDLDAVMEIERVSFRSPWSRQVFLEEMARDWAHVDVVREADGGREAPGSSPGSSRRVVAFGNYWLVADEVHVLNLATHPQARRSGHASRMLAHMIDFARRELCRYVTLEVRRSNAAALRLYRRFAFRAVGVRPNYYAEDQEDAIVMLLDLG